MFNSIRTTFIASLVFTASTLAAPLSRRQANPTDLLVLKFAGVLERLETAFYEQALAKFQDSDFTSAGFGNVNIPKELFTTILADEKAHTSILESTIVSNGGEPITTCQFDFSTALTDVATMAAVARVVENAGVSAYMGAAPLMVNKELLTAAASILTIEARHQTMLNLMNGATHIPQAFDIALSPSQILALAGPFISGCDLGIPANPPLTISNNGAVGVGSALTFTSTGITDSLNRTTAACQMMTGGAPFAISQPLDNCIVPEGINGPVYIFVTNTTQPLLNSQVNQLSSSVIAGPALVFLDTVPDSAAAALKIGDGTSVSKTIITPAEASAVVDAAKPAVTDIGGTTGMSSDGKIEVIGWSTITA